PGGAYEALALRPDVARRMTGAHPGGRGAGPLDRGGLVRSTVTAQRYATGRAGMRVAPRLRASEWTPEDRWHELQTLSALRPVVDVGALLVGMETAQLVALTASLVVAPLPALAMLAAWSAQP